MLGESQVVGSKSLAGGDAPVRAIGQEPLRTGCAVRGSGTAFSDRAANFSAQAPVVDH